MVDVDAGEISEFMRGLRQRRKFADERIPYEVMQDILEVARWTGSAKNSQPWDLIVVRDREALRRLSDCGQFAGFLAGVDVAIVIALHGYVRTAEIYDEGRISERMMLIADAYNLGSGTAWFGDETGQQLVKELLAIPAEWFVHSAVGFGYPDLDADDRPGVTLGRRPLMDVVSYERFGARES
ncbi:MAG: nitroreductase family protein [Thermomicrobiales bacterium]